MFASRIIAVCTGAIQPKVSFSTTTSCSGRFYRIAYKHLFARPTKKIQFRKNKIYEKSKEEFDLRVEAEHRRHIGVTDKITLVEKLKIPQKKDEDLEIEVVYVPEKTAQSELEDTFTPYRFVYPEFLPDPTPEFRNKLKEKLERADMLQRRSIIDIPEFYVGSVLSVTVSEANSPGKSNTFVGICIAREKYGLNAFFTLRNIVEGEGVEVSYDMYNPTMQNITVLKLEKRLDENLRYLRDAPPEYSTFPFDMIPELRNPDAPVPINPLKIRLNPKPWSHKWHLWDLKGVDLVDIKSQLERWQLIKWDTFKAQTNADYNKYDLMKTYRASTPVEDQVEIFRDIHPQLSSMSQTLRKLKRKRTFVKPQKTA